MAEQTDLTRHLDTEARNLTVGGMKRLEVARALAIQPRILLLDEVMAGLNPTDIEKSIQMIRRIRDSGVSVLLIEHMMQATMALSDRIVVLNEGAVLVSGAPRTWSRTPPSSRPIWARSIRMLKVSKLCSGYGKSQVLNGLDFEVRAGEIVTLIGANGAGKTTTLKTLCGVVAATGGKVEFEGRDLTNRPPYDIVDAGITMIPEGRQLFPHFTVKRQSADGLVQARRASHRAAQARRGVADLPACASGWPSTPARCPAENSRWWRSRAA